MKQGQIQDSIIQKLMETCQGRYGIVPDSITVEIPPKVEMGDLAFPIAFELAKLIKSQTGEKQNPREIAQVFCDVLRDIEGIDRIEIAGPGYLNIFLKRIDFLLESFDESVVDTGSKRTVEHTSVNPNKAAHIGHVRNSVLGDTLARILEANGNEVEVQNYIDNTGVQVADVVVGFMALESMSLDDIKALDISLKAKGESFDYYCWDLYTKVGRAYETDDSLRELRAKVLHDIEEGGNPTAELADYVA